MVEQILRAVRRARELENKTNDPKGPWHSLQGKIHDIPSLEFVRRNDSKDLSVMVFLKNHPFVERVSLLNDREITEHNLGVEVYFHEPDDYDSPTHDLSFSFNPDDLRRAKEKFAKEGYAANLMGSSIGNRFVEFFHSGKKVGVFSGLVSPDPRKKAEVDPEYWRYVHLSLHRDHAERLLELIFGNKLPTLKQVGSRD